MEILSPLNQSIFQWDKSCQDESVDNFDLSMNMSAGGAENADGYMSVDQTFHTPSFGDEEFDIPPINLPPSSGSNANPSDLYITSQAMSHQQQDQNNSNHHMSQNPQQQQPPTSCSQSMAMSLSDPTRVMTTMSSTPSPSMNMMDGGQPHQYPGPQHHEPPNQHDMYNMQMGSTGAMLPPQSVQFQVQQYAVPTSYANSSMQTHMQSLGGPLPPGVHHHQQQQQPQQHSLSVLPHQMHHFHPNAHHMQQQQQHQQQILPPTSMLSLQLGPPRLPRPASVGSSPPGSNHTSPGLETSEDSDDSGHISQLMGGIKRPSPEPVERPPSGGKSIKKPKVQKKKKKRDPNEPQKPVSAYALFFRDTQAAIKGQNPNASFGEVSKIVASMWDSLDIEHKNVYKKKTEAAKKEYLKALAAYRASLVTKAANDQSDSIYGSKGVPTSSSMQSGSVHSQTLSPLQKKSPLLASLMEGTAMTSLQNMTQPQPLMVGQGQMGGSNGVLHHQHMLSQHLGQHGPPPQQMLHHLSPNGQMMQTMAIRPPPVSQMMTLNPNHSHQVQQAGLNNNNNHNYSQNMMPSSPQLTHPGQSMNQGMMNPSQMQNCLRNPPTGNEPQDWEREYCNNDCVVSHCRDVYTTWVSSRQPPNSYASVK